MQALQIIHKKKKKKSRMQVTLCLVFITNQDKCQKLKEKKKKKHIHQDMREREPKSQSTISLKLIKPTKELLSYEKDKIMVLSPKTNKVNRHFLLYLFFFFLEYSSLFYCQYELSLISYHINYSTHISVAPYLTFSFLLLFL